MSILILLVTLIATTVGAISGIGGGVLIKPVLDAVTDLSSSQISFLSGTTVLIMTSVSLLRTKDVSKKVSIKTVWLGIGSAVGGLVGKSLFDIIKSCAANDALVSLIQNIVMVILTVCVFIYTLKKSNIKTINIENRILTLIIGLGLGILSSFLGIGGGPINLMILSYCFSMDTKTAALNSLFVILLSQIVSFTKTAVTGFPTVDWKLLAIMSALGVVGAMIGRKLSSKMDNNAVDKLFICLMSVIILLSIYNCSFFALKLF